LKPSGTEDLTRKTSPGQYYFSTMQNLDKRVKGWRRSPGLGAPSFPLPLMLCCWDQSG
jgi:hypothetical protein